jgi:ferrous iron transport protein A
VHLADCPLDTDVTVLAVDPDCSACLRMCEIGLRVGSCVRVTQRGPAGTRVVAVGASRVALDAQTAARIRVAWDPAPVGAAT